MLSADFGPETRTARALLWKLRAAKHAYRYQRYLSGKVAGLEWPPPNRQDTVIMIPKR